MCTGGDIFIGINVKNYLPLKVSCLFVILVAEVVVFQKLTIWFCLFSFVSKNTSPAS